MTKARRPLSPHAALTAVAYPLGWPRVAAVVGRAEATVRNWSDPDTTAGVTFERMLLLDSEFVEAGGGFRPFAAAFASASDLEDARIGADDDGLVAAAAQAAKETGEAFAASYEALRLGAPDSALHVAEHQEAEAYAAHGRFLQKLRSVIARRGRR